MPLELIAVLTLLPVSLMVAVAVLWAAVGLTNQVLGVNGPARATALDRGSAYFRPLDPTDVLPVPEPGFLHTLVSVPLAAGLTAAAGFVAGYLLVAFETAATVRPIEVAEVLRRATGPTFLMAAVPVFLLAKAWVLSALLPTSFLRACGVVLSAVVVWAILGLAVAGGLLVIGVSPSVLL